MIQAARRFVKFRLEPRSVRVDWVRKELDAWLPRWCAGGLLRPPALPGFAAIEALTARTDALGPQPLWVGYGDDPRGPTRRPAAVRTLRTMGALFAGLAAARHPDLVVEIGAAFGVSSMYWLAGLNASGTGLLHTFEPNAVWAQIARDNLRVIGDRFRLTVGTFEDHVESALGGGRTIDIAFIDAIHTRAFVLPQLALVLERSKPGALVVLDDINFSDDMRTCWADVSRDPRFSASARLGDRVGIVELRD